MTVNGIYLFAEEGKVIYRKKDGKGPFLAVRLGFVKNSNGVVVPDSAENYEERER